MTKEAKQLRNIQVLQSLAKQGRIDSKWAEKAVSSLQSNIYSPKTPRGKRARR
jgi:hypothetical protein